MSEQNSLFEKFFMYSLDGVLLTRPDGTILRANPAACRVLERTEQEICRVGRAGLALNDDHLRDVLSQKQASASAAGELSFRRPDGSVFPVEFSSVLMPDGDSAPFSYVVFRDITEQRRLEDAHRRTNRALRLLTRCNQALARATTEEALFTEVCKVMVEGGGYQMCWVGLAENDVHKTVRPVAHAGSEDGYLATADIVWSDTPNGQGPTGTAMRTGRPVVGRDFANDPILKPWRQQALRHGYRSSISLPLALEGQQIGVITMYSAECEVFDDEELAILVQLSTDLAYGILALRERAARVRADDALRRSETMLKRITDAIPEPIFLKDREGRWIFANPATLEVLGKPRDLVLGKTDQEIHANPGIAQALVETDRRIMESGEAEVVEEIVEGRDGQRLFLSSKAPLRDLDGRVIGIVGSARDITDRKHVDEALRERDYLLSESQRIAHIGTWSWELPSNALRWSDEAYRIYGVTPESFALTPQSFLHFLHPDDLPAMQAWTRSCSSQQRPGELAFRIVRLDGTVRVLEGRGELIDAKDHRSAHMTGTVQDVTERKQVEADRERLTAAIEQAAETVVVSDVQGNIVYVNPAFEALTGYTRAEVLGHNPRILKSGVHDEAFYGALWATISSGKNWHGRLVNKKKDGTHFTEDATISPVRDATGVITSYVAVKRDISRDLALEAQLRQSQKMDSVGRLAGGVAHDFNNILSVILGCAEFALEDLPQGDRSRDDILEIEKAAKRAAALTRQLLAFSRKQVLRPVPLDLNGVLVDMKKMLQRLLGEDMSGYTDDAIVHHGILDQGTHLIGKPLTRVELLQTVRDVLDG
ncbi:MAG: PAS domain S-box protein [Myxococcales bacterium]